MAENQRKTTTRGKSKKAGAGKKSPSQGALRNAGISKDAFVQSSKNPELNASLTYDLVAGLRADICRKIDSIKETSTCQLQNCDVRFVKKVHPKVPLSVVGFIGTVFGACFLILAGIIKWETIFAVWRFIQTIPP